MITQRDQDILNFIEDFHAATTSQLHRLFFRNTSYRYSRKRLQCLYEQGFLRRMRSTINNEYAYYLKKPSMLQQIHHDLLRAELYVNIKERYKLLEWNNEMRIGNIRPDAVAYIEYGLPLMIEIHLSNRFNFDKYKKDFVSLFGTEPRIVICTDKALSLPDKRYKLVKTDMTGAEALI
jgi:hypothetical protein